MRNEAKYICCMGGFLGFLSFFTISLLLGEDVLSAVVKGSVGCLFFALCARGILHLALTSLVAQKKPGVAAFDAPAEGDQAEVTDAPEEIARVSAEKATTEALSEPSPNAVESLAA